MEEAQKAAEQAVHSKVEAEEKAKKAIEAEEKAQKALEQAERSRMEAEEKAKKAIEQEKKLEQELHEERRRAVADVLLDSARLAVDLTCFRLGVGATGSTYRGTYRFPALVQPAEVAVKVFLGGHAIDRAARQQIVTEMRLSTKAEHPNLIRIFGIVELQEHALFL